MKRVLVVFLIYVMILSGCTAGTVSYWNWIKEDTIPVEDYVGLAVYERNEVYSVVIEENGRIDRGVYFSADREVLRERGVALVRIDSVKGFLGMTLEDVEKSLGQIHVDWGSGFSHPAYITSDCYMVYFALDNDVIMSVNKVDLINRVSVEYYQCWSDEFEGFVDLEN